MSKLCSTLMAAVETQQNGTDWEKVGATVFTGIVVVFLILIILVVLLTIMGKINSFLSKDRKKEKVNPPAQISDVPVVAVATQNTAESEEGYEDDDEIIAVISAAIAAYGAADGKTYRIAGIKRKKDKSQRSGWEMAGISENIRPF